MEICFEDVLMVGDDVLGDVIGAQDAGLRGCLVKTGKYRTGDETSTDKIPDFVFDSFADCVKQLLEA